jgi:putative acetyltransferase
MLEIKKLENLSEDEAFDLKKLLLEYGRYMYEELNLIAGKETYSSQIKAFPDKSYKKPDGGFLLASYNGQSAGCVGLRRFDEKSCEMKRMYVSPHFRGLKIAEELCKEIINMAREYGYSKMLLDTNKEMDSAIKLYLKYGFIEIPAYCENENQNPVYMLKKL